MVKVPILRIGRKKTGKVSIKDGEFKMVIKERARLIGVITTFFTLLIIIIGFIVPAFIAGVALIWLITTVLMGGLLDSIVWTGRKITDFIGWVGKWCIRQPLDDFRYGRRKRKEFEASKTYGE